MFRRLLRVGFWIVVCAAVLWGGLCLWLGHTMYETYRTSSLQLEATQDWVETRGEVERSRARELESGKARVEIVVAYSLGEREFRTSQVTLDADLELSSLGRAQELADRFPTGATVELSVDPENPARAVLLREFLNPPLSVMLFVCLLAVGIGLGPLALLLGRWSARRVRLRAQFKQVRSVAHDLEEQLPRMVDLPRVGESFRRAQAQLDLGSRKLASIRRLLARRLDTREITFVRYAAAARAGLAAIERNIELALERALVIIDSDIAPSGVALPRPQGYVPSEVCSDVCSEAEELARTARIERESIYRRASEETLRLIAENERLLLALTQLLDGLADMSAALGGEHKSDEVLRQLEELAARTELYPAAVSG